MLYNKTAQATKLMRRNKSLSQKILDQQHKQLKLMSKQTEIIRQYELVLRQIKVLKNHNHLNK